MGLPEIKPRPFGPIYDRIGPIFDPAFLKIISEEQIKHVVLTVVKAEHAALVAQTKAMEEVMKTVESVRVQTAR